MHDGMTHNRFETPQSKRKRTIYYRGKENRNMKKTLIDLKELRNYRKTVQQCCSGAMTNWGARSYFELERGQSVEK